ncbi:nuclear transport factor 2 family protein [Pseudomonas sp. MWU13-2625]|nr:nuclear transport factor 2 family protein [Pseudomonas sp. MWU13-2625]
MDLLHHLLHLEQRLLSRAVREDAAELALLIADDFVEFGASGGIWNKSDVLEALPQQAFTQRTVSQFTLKPLSEDSALVTYHCHTGAVGQRVPVDSLRSSVWRRQGEQWQMVFHQGTFCARP